MLGDGIFAPSHRWGRFPFPAEPRKGGRVEILDVQQLLTYEEAAQASGIRVDTLRVWRNRGHLPQARDRKGRPLYRGRSPLFRLIDVARAEYATRHRARRTIPTAA